MEGGGSFCKEKLVEDSNHTIAEKLWYSTYYTPSMRQEGKLFLQRVYKNSSLQLCCTQYR
jgi:hypothetical protein